MTITTNDGRSLDVVVHGDDGPALLFHHGTPSRAADYAPWVAAARAAGLRWVSISRPGYGASTRRPGRSVADDADDAAHVLDHLGVDRFVAVGWSGGGPHALACGALLAPRCAGVVTLAGVAPKVAALDWLDGMGPENVAEFGAAAAGEPELRHFLDAQRDGLVDVTGAEVAESLGGLVDAPDRAVLSGEFADDLAASFRDALRVGVDGWLDDDLAFVRPWGFDLADVGVPASVWQGEDDRMVPFAHGRYLAEQLPDARSHLFAGEGHLSITVGMFEQILAEVRALAGE